MSYNTKSSITLPPQELKLVLSLQKKLGAKTKVQVVRKGLELLREKTEREALREAFKQAAQKVKAITIEELKQLDHLSGEQIES